MLLLQNISFWSSHHQWSWRLNTHKKVKFVVYVPHVQSLHNAPCPAIATSVPFLKIFLDHEQIRRKIGSSWKLPLLSTITVVIINFTPFHFKLKFSRPSTACLSVQHRRHMCFYLFGWWLFFKANSVGRSNESPCPFDFLYTAMGELTGWCEWYHCATCLFTTAISYLSSFTAYCIGFCYWIFGTSRTGQCAQCTDKKTIYLILSILHFQTIFLVQFKYAASMPSRE